MKQIKNIYDHLPAPLGNLAFSAAGANIQRTRYGRGFHEMLAEFESHEGWPAERVAEWRDARLRKLICHAYRTVPYYHDLMDEGGVDPASIKGIDDLEMLPTLTKDMVKSAPERFVSSEASSMNLMHVHTSGTTGSGFRFLSTVECQQAQFACFWRYYRKHGIDIGTWQAQFSSRQAVPKRVSTPPFWRIDYPGRRYYMSAFHESPANLRYYYEVIQENRFEWISGYPSLMVLLAQWMNERDLRFDFIRAVTCGAENLLDHQADAMERAFGVRPVQTYGQTENVAIFSQQPDRRILVDEDFSAVEFLPTANNAGGGILEVVGTCLFNYATPLIRYRTKDIVTLGDTSGPRREIASLDGRQEDYISLPDGTRVGKLDHVFKDTPHFQEAQIYQRKDYSVVLRVVGEPYMCVEDERTALGEFRASTGGSIPVEFEYLPSIDRKGSAKLRFVVSEVGSSE